MAIVYTGVGDREISRPGTSDEVHLRLLLLDDADPSAGKTGIAFDAAGMTVEYCKPDEDTFTTFPTFATENWGEIGHGWYDLVVRGSDATERALLDTNGDILFYVKATATKEAQLRRRVVGADIIRGDGDTTVTVTCQESDGTPISGAKITVKDAAEAAQQVYGLSRANGTRTFSLDVTVAHRVLVSKLGQYTFDGTPFDLAVGATALTCVGEAFSPSAPAEPDTCVIYGWVLDEDGAVSGAEVRARPVNPPLYDATGQLFQSEEMSATTNASGYWELPIPHSEVMKEQGTSDAHWKITCPSANLEKVCVIPSEASKAFDDLAAA